jgi:PKD repeat protein
MKIVNYIVLLTALLLVFSACKRKHKYQACFNFDKSSAKVGEVVTFTNCSNYDKGYTNARWTFGDGTIVDSKDSESVQHTYNAVGNYQINLRIGEKENGSEEVKSIPIQP